MTEKSPPILWRCPPERLDGAPLSRYLRRLERTHGLRFDDYDALWEWSTRELEQFWESIWQFFEVGSPTQYARVLDAHAMPGARWFEGASVNFAEYCFRGREDDAVAIVHASELRDLGEWTWGELRDRVAAIRGGLEKLGVERGDRVAAYLPNLPETMAAFLACASIGAIWSSCSPDFGAPAVIDRFRQIEPKVLLAVDGYRYGGRDLDRTAAVDELRRALPSVEHTVLLDYLEPGRDAGAHDALPWSELEDPAAADTLSFEMVPFDHPLWVLYSSGTTGLPKPIVHGQGGILLELLKLHSLQHDLREGDRFFWFSTTGWVMWNIVVSALLTPAAIVLYDGNPAYPDQNRLWSLAREAGVTCFGSSAAFLTGCMKAGIRPAQDGQRIHTIGSTGSPLPPEAYRWIYEHFPAETWLFSVSGGTDVAGAFVGGVLTVPVYEGEISARALGARVEAWDEDGNAMIGATGELVVTEPMPSMPLYLWGDKSGERFRESYFSTYPGVWRHGDWIEITDRGTAIIRGRSDSTINRAGVRVGTSEIYRAVLSLDEVVDAVAVDVPRRNTHGFVQLFVVLASGTTLDDALNSRLRDVVRTTCSPRHVPDDIVQIPEVPRTISGKVLEVPIKRILMGAEPDRVVSRGSLANPAALDWFIDYASALDEAYGAVDPVASAP
jgi:acetoacetyl-CoA synthetase